MTAGGVLAAVAVVGTAGSASADEGTIDHFCGSLRLPDDNGPITDVLHHTLEDPLRPLPIPVVTVIHGNLCRVAGLEETLLGLLAPKP